MLSVLVLPMYNEEKSIALLQRETREDRVFDVIIAVDDGSKDETLRRLHEWKDSEPRLSIVSYSPNRGLPGAITEGFVHALEYGADIIVTMDADASHPVSVAASMIDQVRKGYDIVIASRHAEGASESGLSVWRMLLSWGASLLMRNIYRIKGLRDYSTNYRAYRASLIRQALAGSNGRLVEASDFSGVVELLLRLCSLNPKITEVPLDLHYDRKVSASKVRVLRTIRGYLRLVMKRKTVSSAGVCLPLLSHHGHSC